jgi:lysozyme
MNVLETLIRHEDLRQKPYLDCCGKYWRECTCEAKGNLTIGVGLNLDNGISDDEAIWLANSRIERARVDAATFAWFPNLDSVRQDVIVMMIYNMGLERLKKFVRMATAIEQSDFKMAAIEMLNSRWETQVGDRAHELAAMMFSGVYPTPPVRH